MGQRDLAIRAATIAFDEEQSLNSYLHVQDLTGDRWSGHREQLLDRLRRTRQIQLQGPVDIFLHEGLIGDAIVLIDRDPYPYHRLVEQVADAAIQTHPDWVIEASRKQAEPIIHQKKADKYDRAVHWLAKAKQAYIAAGRQKEWNEYRDSLLEQHYRKHKLVPMLKALG